MGSCPCAAHNPHTERPPLRPALLWGAMRCRRRIPQHWVAKPTVVRAGRRVPTASVSRGPKAYKRKSLEGNSLIKWKSLRKGNRSRREIPSKGQSLIKGNPDGSGGGPAEGAVGVRPPGPQHIISYHIIVYYVLLCHMILCHIMLHYLTLQT